jgi:hypothetical protein
MPRRRGDKMSKIKTAKMIHKAKAASWHAALWLAQHAVEAEPAYFTRFRVLCWTSIFLIGGTLGIVAFVAIIFHPRDYANLYQVFAANKDEPFAMSVLVVGIAGVGYAAHEFKQFNQWLYGWSEFVFAIIYSISVLRNADLLTPVPAISAIGAAAYLVQRGLNNVHDAKLRRLGAPRFETLQ